MAFSAIYAWRFWRTPSGVFAAAVVGTALCVPCYSAAEEPPQLRTLERTNRPAPIADHDSAGETVRATARRQPLGTLPADASAQTPYLNAEQLRRVDTVSIVGTNTPLRESLDNLSRNIKLAVLLDRRIDPEQVVNFDLTNVPLDEALSQIAAGAQAGASRLGPVAYIGPTSTARALRTLSALRTAEAQRLPAARRAAVVASRPLTYPSLVTPQEVFAALGKEAGFTIEGIDRLPHDLLAGVSLPSLAWVDRMTLMAAQFGLTFEFSADGKSVKLVPIDENPRIERSYTIGRDAAKIAAGWKELSPQADVRTDGGRLFVRATVEDHDRFAASMKNGPNLADGKKPPARAAGGKQVLTLKVEGIPLDAFLASLGEKLSLTFEMDQQALAAAGVKPDTPVSVDVQNVPLEGLLHAALDPLGLKFTQRGTKIAVTADK